MAMPTQAGAIGITYSYGAYLSLLHIDRRSHLKSISSDNVHKVKSNYVEYQRLTQDAPFCLMFTGHFGLLTQCQADPFPLSYDQNFGRQNLRVWYHK